MNIYCLTYRDKNKPQRLEVAADQMAENEGHYWCAHPFIADVSAVVHVGFHDSYCWQNDVLPASAVSILDINGKENCLFVQFPQSEVYMTNKDSQIYSLNMYCPTKKQQRNCYSSVTKDKGMLDIRLYSQAKGISWVLICSITAQGPPTVRVTLPHVCSNHLFAPNRVWMGSHGVSGPTGRRWRACFSASVLACGKHDWQPQLFMECRQVELVSTSNWSRQHGVHKEPRKEEVDCCLQSLTAPTRCSCTTGVLNENERGTPQWHSNARCNGHLRNYLC